VKHIPNKDGAQILLWFVADGEQQQLFWPVSRGVVAAQQFMQEMYSNVDSIKEGRKLFEKGAAEVVSYARREKFLIFSEDDLRFVIEAARTTGEIFRHYSQNSLQRQANQPAPAIRYPAGGVPYLPAGPGGVPTQAMMAVGMGPVAAGMRLGLLVAAMALLASGNSPEETKKAVVYLLASVLGGPENPVLRDKIMNGSPTGNAVVDGMIAGATMFVFGAVDTLRKISETIGSIPEHIGRIFK
jgi:hypothetical protein